MLMLLEYTITTDCAQDESFFYLSSALIVYPLTTALHHGQYQVLQVRREVYAPCMTYEDGLPQEPMTMAIRPHG